jgi:hypothetical protein
MANLFTEEQAGIESGLGDGIWVGTEPGLYYIEDSTERAHTGSHSIRWVAEGTEAYTLTITSNFATNTPLTPDVEYEFSMWAYAAEDVTPGHYMFVTYYYSATNDLVGATYSPILSEIVGGWAQYSYRFTPLPGTASGVFAFFVGTQEDFGSGPPWFEVGEERFFDDFYVDLYAVPTPFTTPPSLRQRQNPLRVK